ncbi:sulfite exporter TauE/SafE family protein [Candidatus Poseidoniales archaeon]|nr:sulfite exporter TauE/SafE family protein [Candidatus Poseidoniales archaeon]MDA9571256.1 sulfite exporter TauE/SafE family protein [Candidatus Poseidoniales archaeon]
MDASLIVFSLFATFFAAALTVPAGFGLATMITPIVFLWLEPHEAVAVVGIVHGSHNAWKLKVLRSSVDYSAVRRYGWAMVVGALLGAALNTAVEADPLLLIVGVALVVLPLLSMSERWTNVRLPDAEDRIGGFGSGFFGGLTGHQGALRAMFLQKRLPNKTEYAATAAVLALVVDVTRVPVYVALEGWHILDAGWLIVGLVLAAVLGVHLGKRWLKKWKSDTIRNGILVAIVASGVLYIREAAVALGWL